ncbi:unnamed protein product [Arabidopsis lyrata]|uniref:Predicted protein n=1 Tax=Arabidopsis lyrata subsp. lyrata TaxID=81972 RepID=D7MQU3_ARALL|nr:predicted protein [Arabidopsis lyrata subsp. lyrata]CAH8278629.1 unnamed protein product [Arabidopsis lyrata]
MESLEPTILDEDVELEPNQDEKEQAALYKGLDMLKELETSRGRFKKNHDNHQNKRILSHKDLAANKIIFQKDDVKNQRDRNTNELRRPQASRTIIVPKKTRPIAKTYCKWPHLQPNKKVTLSGLSAAENIMTGQRL